MRSTLSEKHHGSKELDFLWSLFCRALGHSTSGVRQVAAESSDVVNDAGLAKLGYIVQVWPALGAGT